MLGAIDGCHIEIRAPCKDHTSYINRKGFHSINLQAVCDCNLRFTDVYIGEVGSVHDARVFKRSPRFQTIRVTDFPNDTHLLADAAYPLCKQVMVPFRDNGHLSAKESNYNKIHARTRNAIERAFSLLKNRFRRLKYLDMGDVQGIPSTIMACCILHNVCLNSVEDILDIQNSDSAAAVEGSTDKDDDNVPECVGRNTEAINKRKYLVELLM